jgi:hypothetical protein
VNIKWFKLAARLNFPGNEFGEGQKIRPAFKPEILFTVVLA